MAMTIMPKKAAAKGHSHVTYDSAALGYDQAQLFQEFQQ
jgi:hypothetical protein